VAKVLVLPSRTIGSECVHQMTMNPFRPFYQQMLSPDKTAPFTPVRSDKE